MCFELLAKIFGGGKPVEPELTLPHPEEAPNYYNTVSNMDMDFITHKYYGAWRVPIAEWPYWDVEVDVICTDKILNPAETSAQTKTIKIRPEWANPGVLAHEIAHVDWQLLDDTARIDFSIALTAKLDTDPMIKLLHSKNTYMDTSVVEAHAEVYRYLGEQMPSQLKQFYPKLF